MATSLRSLYAEAKHYSKLLANCGSDLLEYSKYRDRHPGLVASIRNSYVVIGRNLVQVYREIRRTLSRSLYKENPPRLSLEQIERSYLNMLNDWNRTEARASKLSVHGGNREAKAARQVADALAVEVERIAKLLVIEANKLGRWTQEWERDLGIRQWLR